MPPAQNRKPVEVQKAGANEYIPNFISKKPFYVVDDSTDPSSSDYLEHQRLKKSSDEQEALLKDPKWYDRGQKLGPAATKFRNGACENCGAMTHQTKECLSRPRKQGAKWTGKDIQADEVVQNVNLGWDAKRDRWNGYDAAEYDTVVKEFQAIEELKKKMKDSSVEDTRMAAGGAEAGDAKDADGAKYEEETDMGRQQSTSTRNLRLREDTAKYLINLEENSAQYNPKTRTMLDPGANDDQAAALVIEEGFMRASGDAAEFEKAQKYAWEMGERGDKNRIHLQANPTSGEHYRKKEQQEGEARRGAQRKALLEKYGGSMHLQSDPLQEAVVESDRYVEYDERGLIRGALKTKANSQYPENVFFHNHTLVWGSWWRDFKWGYACCHSNVKNSYCTGEEGIRALEETDRLRVIEEEVPKQIAWREEAPWEGHVPKDEVDQKVKVDTKDRKRTLGQMKEDAEDEDLEQYRKKRVANNDPMRALMGTDELVA